MAADSDETKTTAHLGPAIDDAGSRVVRLERGSRIGYAVSRPIRSGTAVDDECVVLADTPDPQPFETIGEVRRRRGPAKVASTEYRTNYDNIFGRRPAGQA